MAEYPESDHEEETAPTTAAEWVRRTREANAKAEHAYGSSLLKSERKEQWHKLLAGLEAKEAELGMLVKLGRITRENAKALYEAAEEAHRVSMKITDDYYEMKLKKLDDVLKEKERNGWW
jgi:hypothetical protein